MAKKPRHAWACAKCGTLTMEFSNTRMNKCLSEDCDSTTWEARRIEVLTPDRADFKTQYPFRGL